MRQQRRKFLLVSSVLIVLVLAGFGCKGLSQEEKEAVKPVTLEFWTVFDDIDALEPIIAQYKAARSYLTINVRQVREGDFYPRLLEALAEDNSPDIISVRHRSLAGLLPKLAALPPVLTDTTVQITKGKLGTATKVFSATRPGLTPEGADQEFVQVVFKDVVQAGSVWGLPLSLDTLAVYYNKDLLDRAGVPEPPQTWEEFQAAVKKLTRYDKTTGSITQAGAAFGTGKNITGSDDLLFSLFKQSGLEFTDRLGRAVFNLSGGGGRGAETPAMSVINFYTDFASPARDTYTWNDTLGPALDAFINGTTGFFFGYSYHHRLIKARAPQLNFGVLPLFQLNPEAPINAANYWVLAVPNKSAHQSEAWALVDYLTRSAATAEYLAKSERPTARRDLLDSQKENSVLRPFAEHALVAENWYRGNNPEAATRAIVDLITAWLAPPPDPDRILEWRQELLNRAAARINQTL